MLYKNILGFTAHTDGENFQWKEQELYIGNTKINVTGCQLDVDAWSALVD
jgi:hypothetical protein